MNPEDLEGSKFLFQLKHSGLFIKVIKKSSSGLQFEVKSNWEDAVYQSKVFTQISPRGEVSYSIKEPDIKYLIEDMNARIILIKNGFRGNFYDGDSKVLNNKYLFKLPNGLFLKIVEDFNGAASFETVDDWHNSVYKCNLNHVISVGSKDFTINEFVHNLGAEVVELEGAITEMEDE